ncbi:DUF3995 domain-containing protein [Tersicoccus sp. MR15.9]|uniref:DUF3995 domain-containing protein n=1 Tax=Tersicoccus mangrovi TaxID=3121635 RepID=UPI002FE50BF6
MDREGRRRGSLTWVWLASVAGLVHAGVSAYWALGGRALLSTVGSWAVQLAADAPVAAGLGLGVVAVVKAAAAVVPAAVAHGRIGGQRGWRAISWAGAAALIVYGGANTAVSNAVLTGLIDPAGGYDRDAMIGHAWLWDPLFLLWGLALAAHLWTSRRGSAGDLTRVGRTP